ncbi:MAG: hypothetical protein HYR64_10340 [Fimbriimonas ginsengisoli]|uniref:DUF5666 domain-containing protein n=1 Tax=Fimbriimonas ginsengisoli TaxID=1005039 RepID=A0A931LX97_FIMGI|nr:hypothetical protein [Fimbriimonas ginsengisoli]
MKNLLVAFVVASIVLAASAGAQVTKKGNGYLLRVKHVRGQTLRYRTSTTIKVPSQTQGPMQMLFPISETVLSVASGVADVDVTAGPISMNGKQIQPAKNARMKINSQNVVVEGAGSGVAGAGFPDKPVKVGHSWTSSMPIGGASGPTSNVIATLTLKAVKSQGGRRVAIIGFVAHSDSQKLAINGKGTLTLRADDGTMQGMVMAMDLGVQGKAVQSTTTITRS